MSTYSVNRQSVGRRLDSQGSQSTHRHSRTISVLRKRPVGYNDAYTYALRVAYLSYLLQPRTRRTQSIPVARPTANRSSASFHDLMKDFSLVRDSKSTRFPHGFVSELEKRLTGVLIGKERRKEYHDAAIKRTFAVFLNTLKEQTFKKRMEKDRRVEDLVLIFFSNATKELSKGKDPEESGWKLMVDRHVALFVRLITLILKDHDWNKDKPELASRLSTLESKLLAHDQDLAQEDIGSTTSEVLAPLSYDANDMPLVQVVAKIFGLRNSQVQSDINKNKDAWTPKLALQDLKTYQTHLNLNTRRTLAIEDFDTVEAYESWKKAEGPDLSQMMLAIVQCNPELAKSTPGGAVPHFSTGQGDLSAVGSDSTDKLEGSSYVINQPVDLSSLSLSDESIEQPEESDIYTFIPPDPRSFYRFILNQAISHDLQDRALEASEATSEVPSMKLLSKQSTELLNELCLRWRIPSYTRIVLFLDVFREKYVDQEIDMDTLDAAFTFVKEPPPERSKRSSFVMPSLWDRSKWTIADINTMQQLLSSLYDALLRQLYETMMHCFDTRPVPIGPVMYVLDNHVVLDPNFSPSDEDQEQFRLHVTNGLLEKAKEVYQELLDKEIPPQQEQWEFIHVTQLGRSILKLAERIQKRYKKNPEIMGYVFSMIMHVLGLILTL